ncbi:dienelactone hydrolase family protein [Roseococcus sp. YIM B11640]|uniref:dienelactone hydrolase family protein n=1 Tax=Roseococcus sp. YIM B11640 TaxID=3133973 RepID=UPI003C7C2F5B
MRRILAATLLATLPLAPAAADRPERFPLHDHPAITGVMSLPLAPAHERAPAVLVLPDALGPDRRADPYVEALNAAGMMVLEVDLESVSEQADIAPAEAAALVLRELARDPRVEHGRIGVLGFGAGGRAALLALPGVARVALYPGCAGLPGVAGRALIVHGEADAANTRTDCARLGTARAEIPGAGYAWDRPPHGGEGPSLLPRPDGAGRIVATPHPQFWAVSVPLVADWLVRELRDAE